MTSSFTANKSLEQPANGDYVNTWQIPVNGDMSILDYALGGSVQLNVVGLAAGIHALTLTQYQPPIIIITGALTANINYQFPAGVGGGWSVYNNTSGAHTVTFSSATGGGTTVTLTQGYTTSIICDGTNVGLANTTPTTTAGPTYGNVNLYLNAGDSTYDGAIARALAATNLAYFPIGPALGGTSYLTTSTIALSSGQSLNGDGPGLSIISCSSPSIPVVTLGKSMMYFNISNLTLTHGGTPTAGGDGIFQAQNTGSSSSSNTNWVNDGLVQNVVLSNNWNGGNLGIAFYCLFSNVQAIGNKANGFSMLTSGHAWGLVSTDVAGQLQWYFESCTTNTNGPASGAGIGNGDGWCYQVGSSTPGSSGSGISVGTLTGCNSFANKHNGVGAYGNAAVPVNGVRISGGFYGSDAGNGIVLDTYAHNHLIAPDFCELANAWNINISANNSGVVVKVGACVQAGFDGLFSQGDQTVIVGGLFSDNGSRLVSGARSGIFIQAGSANISGVTSRNFNTNNQAFGISVTGDSVAIAGSYLPAPGTKAATSSVINGIAGTSANIGNVTGSIFWTTGPTNSSVAGCFPRSVNF